MSETSFETFTETILSIAPILGASIFFMSLIAAGLFAFLTILEIKRERARWRWVNDVELLALRENRRRSEGAGIPAHIIRDPAVVERSERGD